MPKSYPQWHENDVFNAPRWVFMQGVSVGSVKAARMLGMCRVTFLNYSDSLGLVVYRDTYHRRYYLISQLQEVKDQLGNVTAEDVTSRMEGGSHALLSQTNKRPRYHS